MIKSKKSPKSAWQPGRDPTAGEQDPTAVSIHKFVNTQRTLVAQVRTLSDAELHELVDLLYDTSIKISGVTLYPYQELFGKAIIRDLLFEKVSTITALFARQSGKTETISLILCGLAVLLPLLSDEVFLDMANLPKKVAEDYRISKFKRGFKAGIFTPTDEIATIIEKRVKQHMTSKTMTAFRESTKIGLKVPSNKNPLILPNGSEIEVTSAAPNAKIEGRTFHLITTEETQDISSWVIQKSIEPMGSATAASFVKIGTPNLVPGDFYEACERNKKHDIEHPNSHDRLHFEFDYIEASKWNPQYATSMQKIFKDHDNGESQTFKLSYRLIWLINESRFVPSEVLDRCGIKEKRTISTGGDTFTMYNNIVTGANTNFKEIYFALDVGKTRDSSVLTAGTAFSECPIDTPSGKRFRGHILNWLDMKGDDHEEQYYKIIEFMSSFTKGNGSAGKEINIIVDSTGKGDPIFDRLYHALCLRNDTESCFKMGITDKTIVNVVPFVSSAQANHNGYTLFQEELRAGRFTYPDSTSARQNKKVVEFKKQMYDVQKEYIKGYMKVEAPTKKQSTSVFRDDYVDSAMMLCYLINGGADSASNQEVTVSHIDFNQLRRLGGLKNARSHIRHLGVRHGY